MLSVLCLRGPSSLLRYLLQSPHTGGAQAGYSLYENGFDEEFRPVITIALTQLNIHRTNVTALAVHVKCGDGTGGFTLP